MKICVLVKEVPDAAVQKRIDPNTMRLDRSGEKNLNPFDTHALEAAMQIKEGGAIPVEEVVAVTMGPDSAVRALHKAVALGADRSVHLSDDALAGSDVCATGYSLAKVLESREPRPGPAGPAVGRRRVLHDRRRRRRPPEDAFADPGDPDRRHRRQAALRAPGRVRLRHGRDRAAGRDQRRRRDQRAALPEPESDHGREKETARLEGDRRRRHRRRPGRRGRFEDQGSRRSTRRRRRRPARSSRTRTPTRRSKRSSPGSTRGS